MTELRATYRLMFNERFGFAEARALVPYLADLGVSHLYLPPSFQARRGSTHGYDVIDPTSISVEFGGEEEFRALVADAKAHGLGVVLDIVPNHMAVDDDNRYWADESLRAKFFDIDPATGRHRRFFDIDHLAGVRQEDPEVFEETHKLALALVREGTLDGVRIDHPDGLADPAGYLARLRAEGVEHAWVEKILDPGEKLRADWAVDGTVGYEVLNDLAALFVDPAGEAALDALWHELSGDTRPFAEYAYEAKLEQASGVFRADVERLARELTPEQGARPPVPVEQVAWPPVASLPDLSVEDLARALSSLPIYRTYVDPREGKVSEEDREAIAEAGIAEPLARILTLDDPAPPEFVTRFQQTTPPVMAKGVEDTAFYRYARLIALNEVGGDPSRFGITVDDFHAANLERLERYPRNLLITQTHDTKRSGDARARVGALSGMPDEWAAHVRRWFEVNTPLRADGAPDPVEEYFIYQNLIAAWPIEPERMDGYVEKAMREAKVNTNWAEVNEDWEARVKAFVRGLYDHRPFRESFDPFALRVADAGERASLAQLLLKLTVPGVPDIYQGDELVSLSLVDPDNRRSVDWDKRRQALTAVQEGNAADTPDFRKLELIVKALALRKRFREAFAGSYEPIDVGERAIAFVRGGRILVAAEIRAGGGDAVTDVPGRGRVRLADILDDRGLALEEL